MDTQETGVALRLRDLSPEYAEIMLLGSVLKESGYFKDIRDQAQAVTKILFGRELGISPIVAMSGIHIIEGKPALSATLMATLIKRSGRYDYRVKVWTTTQCVLTFREKVDGKWEDVGESSFSIEDAKTAKLPFTSREGYATNWTKFPRSMLFARALSQGLRTYAPDVSAAPVYGQEEMGMEVNGEGDAPSPPKPIIVANEPVTFTKTQESAPPRNGQDESPLQKGTSDGADNNGAEGAVVDAVAHASGNSVDQSAPSAPTQEPLSGQFPPAPDAFTDPHDRKITVGQQKNFHIECRGAVKPSRHMEADNLTYQWLIDNHYVDQNKIPTAAMIPADIYLTERKKAVAWLRVQ